MLLFHLDSPQIRTAYLPKLYFLFTCEPQDLNCWCVLALYFTSTSTLQLIIYSHAKINAFFSTPLPYQIENPYFVVECSFLRLPQPEFTYKYLKNEVYVDNLIVNIYHFRLYG